jgi:hypothetical protein
VHRADDVAAPAEIAERAFQIRRQRPGQRPLRLGQVHLLQLPRTTDQQLLELRIGTGTRPGAQVEHIVLRALDDRAVKPGEPLGIDFLRQLFAQLEFALGSERYSRRRC